MGQTRKKSVMIVFIGDTHGYFNAIKTIQNKFPDPATIFIQVGDFGYWPQFAGLWKRERPSRPVYFIDGNHDYLPDLIQIKEVKEVWPGAFYIPRGTVLTLDNKRIAFMGGAASVDKARRTPRMDWFEEELITRYDVDQLIKNLSKSDNPHDLEKVDLFVTHTPPTDCIQANFDPDNLAYSFGLPKTWRDPSAAHIEAISLKLGNPPLICGHMHRSVTWRNIQILDINTYHVIE